MYEDILEKVGLTKGESRTYLSLLNIGENTVSPIAKKADVSLSKIYEILEGLIKKGLVSYIIKNNTKYFLATPPERILDFLESKKNEIIDYESKIKEIIPNLKNQKEKSDDKNIATLYEGLNGIKTFYELVLKETKEKSEILVLGIPKYSAERYEGYFLDWNKRRAEKLIKIKIIFDYEAKDFAKKREKIKFTEIKYLSKDITTPAWILIYENGVATIHATKNPICVLIKDKDVVESYTRFFDIFWNLSKSSSI